MKRRSSLILLFLSFAVSPTVQAAPLPDSSVTTRATTHALVIGISRYRDGSTADYAERSAAAFRDMLGRLGVPTGNIECLFGRSATRDLIRNALVSFSKAGPEDNIIIYFAGRSFVTSDSVDADGGIVANEDVSISPKMPEASSWARLGSGISWSAIRLLLGSSPAAGAIVFCDAPAGGLPAGPILLDAHQTRSRMVVAAADRRESVQWDPHTGVTTFVQCISSGLEEGKADLDGDGEVTGSELAEFLGSEILQRSGYQQRVIARSFVPQTAEFRFRTPVDASYREGGILVVRGAPPGAVIAAAGRRFRSAGHDTMALPSGAYPVAVYDRAGMTQSSVQIVRDSTTLLDVELQALPAFLHVHCVPESVSVWLDGQEMGKTPLAGAKVPSGLHALVLRKEGFIEDSSSIFLRPSTALHIRRWLRKPLVLSVTSEPPGAFAKVDQIDVGNTPVVLDGIAEGERFVELSAPDFHPTRVLVQGYWPDTVRVAKKLTSKFGTVNLRSSSGSAAASLDGVVMPSPMPDSCRMLTGTHSLAILDPVSGANVEGSFELGAAQRLDATAEFNYFSLSKCMLGVLIPGLNQVTDRQVLPGIGMLLANAGSLVFALTAQSTLRDRRGTYESARTVYLAATNEQDAIRTRTIMSAAYDDLDRATRTRNIAVSCFAGAFVFSAVHTILFHSRASSLTITPAGSIAVKPTVDVGPERFNYGIAISF